MKNWFESLLSVLVSASSYQFDSPYLGVPSYYAFGLSPFLDGDEISMTGLKLQEVINKDFEN